MMKMYNKTDHPKCKAGRAVPYIRDRHDSSSRPGLLLRLGCAALALMLTVGGVSLLRGSFDVQLPVVHGAVPTISEAAGQTWDSDLNMAHNQTSIEVCKIFLTSTTSTTTDNGGKMVVRSGKTVEMVADTGNNDASVIQILSGATLHLYGTMEGNFDELTIANKEAATASRDGHFYIYLYEGAIFKANYRSDYYIEPMLGVGGVKSNKFECYGCNVGSNLEDRETYPDVSFNKTSDIPVTSNVAVAIGTNTVTNDVTDTYVGRFSLDDPGPIYTITAADKAGFSQVVWTKGPKGDVIETDTDLDHAEDPYVVVNGNVVNIHLKEHARYPAYATYIPDPVWTWNSEHTEATLTTYSYDKEYADDPYGIKGTPHVTNNITGPVYNPDTGKDEYTAAVTLPGEETPRTDTIEIPHDSGGSGDDNGGGSGDDNGGGNGGGSGDDAQNTVVYYFTDDSVWTWTKGSTSGMPVTVKNRNAAEDSQTFGKLDKVSVDGTVIYQKGAVSADDKFEATPGSIKFTFLREYLQTLDVGEHKLRVELTDGSKEQTFNIKASGNTGNGGNTGNSSNTGNSNDTGKGDSSPKTADNNFRLFLAGWLFIASAGMIVMLFFPNKKKRYSHR